MDGLSQDSWEDSNGDVVSGRRVGDGIGQQGTTLDRPYQDQVNPAISLSNSPIRSTGGDIQQPVRESNWTDIDSVHKSPARSFNGDYGRSRENYSPMRDRVLIGNSPIRSPTVIPLTEGGATRSPARSVRGGGFGESLAGEDVWDGSNSLARPSVGSPTSSTGRNHIRSFTLRENVLPDPEEIPTTEKVGAWFDQQIVGKEEVEEEEEQAVYANHLATQRKTSFNVWLYSDENGDDRHQPVPTNRSLNSPRRRPGDYNQIRVQGQHEPEYFGEPARPVGRYTGEGPSYCHPNPIFEDPRHSHDSAGSHNSEMIRSELYRQIKLQERIFAMGESDISAGRGKGIASPLGCGRPDKLYDESKYLRRRMEELALGEEHLISMKPRHPGHGHSHASYASGHNMIRHSLTAMPNEILYNDDPFLPTMPRRPYYQPHYPHQQPAYNLVRFKEPSYDPFNQYPQKEDLHPPHFPTHVHPQALHGDFGHRRSPSVQTEPVANRSDPNGMRGYNSRFAYSTPHARSSSVAISDGNGSGHDCPRKTPVTSQRRLKCHPIACGAPFVVCFHCSHLLQLPKKAKAITESRMKCGSCSAILAFDFENKKSHASMASHSKHSSSFVGNIGSRELLSDECVQGKAQICSVAGELNSETYSSGKTGCTFSSTDSESGMLAEQRRPSSIEAEWDSAGVLGKTSIESDAAPNKVNEPLKSNLSRPPPGSPLQKYIDYSDILAAAKEAANKTDQDQGTVADNDPGALSWNSTGSTAQATVIDVNTDEIPKTDHSQGSTGPFNRKKDEDQERSKKDDGWFFPFMRKGQGSSSVSSSMSTPKADAFVNGQSISHRAVKRAEKLAGPISPGNYWYDSRAGFWGVMGSYCLGIIPPFIAEFTFPMAANCAGGNTSIYINGRELHERDLEVLARRRLPRKINKRYAVDISGRVEDEDTGEFVVDLGRLAPSVERNKCGFGMSFPETQAAVS